MKRLDRIGWGMLVVAMLGMETSLWAQKDTVYLLANANQRGNTRVTGKITDTSPDVLTVQDGSQTRQIPTHTIRKISFADEPSAVDRARDRFDDGRFDDCITELQKVNETPASSLIQQEIEFMKAAANAEIALRGGQVTANQAGQGINEFIRKHTKAYQTYKAVDYMGRLLMAINRLDLAVQQFDRLSQSQAPELKLDGLFKKGNAQLAMEKWDDAKASFDAMANVDLNSPLARQLRLAARCQLARVKAIQGDPATAKTEIEDIIKNESEENEIIFAYAYNAIGFCHEKVGDYKAAALAYLHNELLFVSQHEPRAEALYRLASVWQQLDSPDAASRVRTLLLSRYRNTVWASKLN